MIKIRVRPVRQQKQRMYGYEVRLLFPSSYLCEYDLEDEEAEEYNLIYHLKYKIYKMIEPFVGRNYVEVDAQLTKGIFYDQLIDDINKACKKSKKRRK